MDMYVYYAFAKGYNYVHIPNQDDSFTFTKHEKLFSRQTWPYLKSMVRGILFKEMLVD